MRMSAQSEAISRPYDVLARLFEGHAGAATDFAAEASSHFRSLFASEQSVQAIPVLDAISFRTGTARSNSLVRFVGMVQDTFEPELFASFREILSLGGQLTSLLFWRQLVRVWWLHRAHLRSRPVPLTAGSVTRASSAFRDTVPFGHDVRLSDDLEDR